MATNARADLTESSSWLPTDTISRDTDFSIQFVDLLKGKALCLVDHKVHEGDTDEAAAEPDEEDLGLQVCVAGSEVHEIGGRVDNRPVEEPVRCGGHRESLGSDL